MTGVLGGRAIKAALGRLRLPASIEAGVAESGFDRLAITFGHAERAATLPKHHADPCGRMLIAQSEIEDLVLVTHDRALAPYARPIVWS